jgi:DNA primase
MNYDKIDVRDFLAALEVEIVSVSGHNALFRCPFHGSDRHPSARMSLVDSRWLCSACHEKGNAVGFLAKLRDMSYDDARYFIRQRYNCGISAALPGEFGKAVRRGLGVGVQVPPERRKPPEWMVEVFMSAWGTPGGLAALEYMESRGFDRRTLDLWQIGFDELSGRVAIPVRDEAGVLVGFKARAVDPVVAPRYLYLGGRRYDFDSFSKSQVVFGLNWIPLESTVILVEGELNVVAISQKTNHLAVSVAGSEFSERQRRLIVERCAEVIVWFDEDDAGDRGSQTVFEALFPYIRVNMVRGSDKDAADISGAEIDDLIDSARPAMSEYVGVHLLD